jgi:hypothetical protein
LLAAFLLMQLKVIKSPTTYAVGLASIDGQHFFFTNFF